MSSKDVDLQKLADEGVVQEYGFVPTQDFILQQWLLPDELQGLLPEHPFLAHQVYFYDYDHATGEATLFDLQTLFGRAKRRSRSVCPRDSGRAFR